MSENSKKTKRKSSQSSRWRLENSCFARKSLNIQFTFIYNKTSSKSLHLRKLIDYQNCWRSCFKWIISDAIKHFKLTKANTRNNNWCNDAVCSLLNKQLLHTELLLWLKANYHPSVTTEPLFAQQILHLVSRLSLSLHLSTVVNFFGCRGLCAQSNPCKKKTKEKKTNCIQRTVLHDPHIHYIPLYNNQSTR